jgi:hypothetical protein
MATAAITCQHHAHEPGGGLRRQSAMLALKHESRQDDRIEQEADFRFARPCTIDLA